VISNGGPMMQDHPKATKKKIFQDASRIIVLCVAWLVFSNSLFV